MKIVRKDISGYSIYDSNAFDQEIIDEMLSNGFKELHETEPPTDYNEETMELKQEIVEREDGDYEYKYTAVVSKAKIEKSISLLKQQLANTDYKVIKNAESQMVMEEPPYGPIELHSERSLLRNKINILENLLC